MASALLALSWALALQAQAADFFWDKGARNGRWNTTSANWSGSTWVNSSSNHAFFDTVGGSVNLRVAITAGSVNFGSTASNAPDVTLTTGTNSLVSTSLTVQGSSGNEGTYAANPSSTLSVATVSIAGDIAVGRANLVVSSGTVTANRIITSAASPDWARLVISGGTVTATNGVDGSVNTPATFAIDLNGGTLRAPSIRVSDREVGTDNNAWLTFNGGTIQATADNPDYITLYGGNQNTYIGNGGAIIDTNGHTVGINVNLLANGGGGLTKAGPGTLTLSGQNNYLGTTRIDGGVLSLSTPTALPAAGWVEIANGALMHLGFSGNLTVGSLLLNGVAQPAGSYGAATHPGHFTGSGQLIVPPTQTNAFTWDNGAGTGQWNTTDANWSGSTWIDSSSNHAFFSTLGGTVTLSQAVTAGSVDFGSSTTNAPDLTLTGGSLVSTSLTVQGKSDNSGAYAGNPSLTLAVPTVSIAGDMAVGRANLVVAGGTVTAGRITTAAASADWGRLVVSGGTLTATNGVDGSVNSAATFAIDLNGGTLRTPSIRVADREAGTNNSAWLTLNGGTLQATADNPDFITLYGGNQNAKVGSGGAIIDTAGHEIGINANLQAAGIGGLSKIGEGTLFLTGVNTYYGPTTVHEGTLRVTRPTSRMEVKPGGLLELDFLGNLPLRELVIDGVSLPTGVYNASTHPGRLAGTGSLMVSTATSGYSNVPWPGMSDGVSSFRRMKYGYFVHYVLGGVRKNDGTWPSDANDLADRFDAEGFANDLQSMGVEYLIFTAWHYNMVCLWPSAAMNQWMPGHTVNRDVLTDMLDAVKAKGIRVLFYTHPRDGHDMNTADQIATGWGPGPGGVNPDWNQFDRQKWNDFINDIYADLIDRYGSRIDGLFIDEGSADGDSWRVVDYPRLRQTIKSRQPDLLMMHNYYGDNYSCDIGATEVSYWQQWVPGTDPNNWPATGRPMSMVMGGAWSAIEVPGVYAPRYNTTEMFRMTVLRAGVNSTDGGGVNWAGGPYAGGGWETGVLEQMQEMGSWIAPIRASICDTYPSQSWITPPNSTINSLSNGIVATRSARDGREFIHVLTPPAGNSLTVPPPADGRGYASASLLETGNPVDLVLNGDGSLTLTLQSGDTWSPRNTVIALEPVSVTWNGNSDDAGPGLSAWSESVDHFTNGHPVGTRFRSGDNVDFSLQGSANALPWVSGFSVGDLRFAEKNHLIQPSGSPTLTLASGRIDVADEITATFQESGPGGTLTLAGDSGLTKTGGGTLVLDLPSQVSGNTHLTAGVLSVRRGALGTQGNIVFDGGTLRLLPGNTEDFSHRIRHGEKPVRIDTGGNHVVWASPLDASNTGGLVKLGSGTLALAGGSAAADSFTIEAGALKLDPATTGSVSVPNAGFENPAYDLQGWSYNPSGTAWNFSPSSGTASNNTPWVGTSPEGVQVAYIQNNGTMGTEVTASADGHYQLSFLASNRPGYPASGLVITLDGVLLGILPPGHIGRGGDFNRFEFPAVRLSAGSHTLAFQGQQNGSDSDTLIDDIRFTAVEAGALPEGASLALTGAGSAFEPGEGTANLDSLAGVAGSAVNLENTNLVITGNDHASVFAGSLTGNGSLTINGTLRLVGDATLGFTGPFINNGLLDIMTWNGTLPAGFINNGIVLDRSKVKIDSCNLTGSEFILTFHGYLGHHYQLQRNSDLSGAWENIGTPLAGNNAPIHLTNPIGATDHRFFYRIAVHP